MGKDEQTKEQPLKRAVLIVKSHGETKKLGEKTMYVATLKGEDSVDKTTVKFTSQNEDLFSWFPLGEEITATFRAPQTRF